MAVQAFHVVVTPQEDIRLISSFHPPFPKLGSVTRKLELGGGRWEFNKLFCHGTVMVIFTLLKNVYFGILTTWYRVAVSILSWTGSSEMAQHSPWVIACGSGLTKVPL